METVSQNESILIRFAKSVFQNNAVYTFFHHDKGKHVQASSCGTAIQFLKACSDIGQNHCTTPKGLRDRTSVVIYGGLFQPVKSVCDSSREEWVLCMWARSPEDGLFLKAYTFPGTINSLASLIRKGIVSTHVKKNTSIITVEAASKYFIALKDIETKLYQCIVYRHC